MSEHWAELLRFFIFGGLIFYFFGWFYAFIADLPADNKAKKWMARFSLLWFAWPLLFLGFIFYVFWKLIIFVFKMASLGELYGRQDNEKNKENFKR